MLRGINKQDMFEDDEDYLQMTSIKTKMITEPSLGHFSGLNVIQNNSYNFLISGKNPLNLHGRILESGISVFKIKF
jgi:hypothetical protein